MERTAKILIAVFVMAVTFLLTRSFFDHRASPPPLQPAEAVPTAPSPPVVVENPPLRRVQDEVPEREGETLPPLDTLLDAAVTEAQGAYTGPDGQIDVGISPYIVEAFLRDDAVQHHLAMLPAADRVEALAEIRLALGFPEDTLDAAAEQDAERAQKWDNGLDYMAARAELMARLGGDAREDALRALQVDYFGRRAQTIAREEARGFFRFARPRVYGVN